MLSWRKEPKNDKLDLSDIKNKYLNKKVNEYLLSEDEKLIIVLIKPQGSPNSFNFLKKLIEFIYEELNKVDTKDGQFHYDLAGNYYDFYIDNKEITSDITRLSFLGGLLIIFTLLLYYRNLSALFVIAIPLFSGIYLNFALTQILIGHLNMMSGFLTTILMGLGLDFGIHLYTRFFKELPYKSLKRALVEGLTHTGVASIGGAITTGIAFYCLTIAQFKGFSEFGLVAGNGVLITALTTLSIQPLLIILLHRLKVKFPIAKKQNHNKNLFHHLVGKLKPIKSIKPFFICLFFFLIAISVFKAKDISFQYNFYKLRGEGVKTEPFEKEVAAILGVTSKPTILLFDDYESLKKMKKNLDQAIEEGKLPLLKSYQSIFDITPEDQEKKLLLSRVLEVII